MRTSSILILLIGAVACEPFFQSGTEHEFLYKGKMLTGIPELDTQFSGLTLEGQVIFQSLGSQKYRLAMRDVRYNKFNEKLSKDRTENWRQLRTPEPSSVPSEYKTILEYPIEFSMQDGEIRDVKVSQEEPEWATNLKKSLVSLIKVQLPSTYDLKTNTVRGSHSLPHIWEVMEQGVDGKCENTYQVTEVPQANIQELIESGLVDRQRCQGKKIYQVMKTRNVNKCTERTSYQVNQPGEYLCPTGNCANMWQRTSMTRYYGCGSSKQNMELEVIVNEGELQQNLRAYKTENVVTGVQQVLKVQEIRSSLSTLPQIQNPRSVEGLFYEYPLPNGEKPESYRDQQKKLRDMSVTSDFLSALGNKDEHSALSKLSPATLEQRIIERLEKVVEDLKEVEEFGEKQVSANVMAITKMVTLLGTEDIKTLYEKVKSHGSDEQLREQMRQMLVEIAVISGTSPAVVFTRHLIESGEMSPLRVVSSIATLPHYVRTPTMKLIDEVFELIKSPVVQKDEQVKINAMLAFGTLVNRACVAKNRNDRFPVFVYGEFCNSEKSEITTKYIPYLASQLQSARNQGEKAGTILALGNLGHESALQILMPYIEGKDQVTPFEQRMAIYSLHNFDEKYRHEVIEIYSSLVFNPSEERDTRIAALSMLLNLEPHTVFFQKLATSTWFEKDTEFHKFVYASLKSLSEIEETQQPNTHTSLYRNSHKAKQVIKMAKPLPIAFSSAMNYFGAEWLKYLEVGYHTHYAHSISQRMQHFYGKIEYFLQQLRFTPIEFCTYLTGHEFPQIFKGHSKDKQSHPEWEQIVSKLTLKSQDKEDTPFHAGLWARLFDDVQIMTGVGSEHVQPLVQKVKNALKDPMSIKNDICGKTPVNLVKVNNWAPTEVIIPSDMGFPIIIEFHMPGVLFAQGEINVECSGVIPSVSLELTQKGSASLSGYVGTICPFSMEVIATGIEEQYSYNYPTKMTTHVKSGKLNMVFSETSSIKSSRKEIDLMTYTVRPFSTIKPIVFVDGIPLTQHQNTKTIESEGQLKNKVWTYGETFGLDLKLRMNTETDIIDRKSMLDHFSLYNYNPINAILFSWTSSAMTKNGQASCRNHEVKIAYNPSRSQTKEIELDLSLDLALKSNNDEPKIVKVYSQQQQQQYQQQQQQQGLKLKSQQMDDSKPEHQKIKKIMSKLNIEEGFGLTTKVQIDLRGGAPRSYSYVLSASHGFEDLKQKWNLHLENHNSLNICVEGESESPRVSLRDEQTQGLEVFYKNTIGFGKTCEEHKVEVTGTTGVSRSQQEKSKSSTEARECRESSRKVDELREEIRSEKEESSVYKKLESELVKQYEKKQKACEKKFEQERTLDEVKFSVKYTPMPEHIKQYARFIDVAVKGVLSPYMTGYKQSHNENEAEVELRFRPEHNTLDMILRSEQEEISYRNIRLPEQLRNVIPMVASSSPIKKISSSVKGSDVYPKCRVGNSVVESFDKKSYHYELDDCYHVLSAETEQKSEYAVLAKEQSGKKEMEVFISGSKLIVRPSRRFTEQSREYEIDFDGQRLNLLKNEKKELKTRGTEYSCKLWRSNDDILVVETPFSRVVYDGMTIEIENTRLSHTQLKGLCGNSNKDKRDESVSAKGCIAQSSKSAAITYRVQTQSCSRLSQQKQKIQEQQQQQQCKTVKQQQQQQRQASKVSQIVQQQTEKCSQMKHTTIRQGKTLCISQTPIVQCGKGCGSRSTPIIKKVPYTCLPSNRPEVVRLYERKISAGEIIPELRNMETAFSAKMPVPVSCSNPGL